MLFISAALGMVAMVIICAIWLILRRGEPVVAPQLGAQVVPQTNGSATPSLDELSSSDHRAMHGARMKPRKQGSLEDYIDDEDVALDAGLSFEASRVERAPRYFSHEERPSFYTLKIEGEQLEAEVRFLTTEEASGRQAIITLHLCAPHGQEPQRLLAPICRWLGVKLECELPVDATLDERGRVICQISGDYFGLVQWQGRSIELFSLMLGQAYSTPLWFGVEHEQGRGWFWVTDDALVRLKVAHHLSILLRGGQPFEQRASAPLPGFVEEPLIRQLSKLSVSAADDIFIRGQRVALVQEQEDEPSFRVLILDHVSDNHARELVSCEGIFGSLDFDEAGQILALTRFGLDVDEDETLFEILDLTSGQLLWSLAIADGGSIYHVCVNPAGDRVALAKHVGGEDDALTELFVYEARTGVELERSGPREILELGRWLDVGIVCALPDDEDTSLARQGVWLPMASRWQCGQRHEVSLPQSYELIGFREDGLELLNGERWPYVELLDLEAWPGLYTFGLEALPWVGPHHLLWSASDDVVLNVRDGSARPLFNNDNLHKRFVQAHGDGVVVVEDLERKLLLWGTFSVAEVSSGGVLTGVAW